MVDFLQGQGLRGGVLRWVVWGGALALWLAPWVAMQLDADGVHWTAMDFVFAAGMLLLAGGAYELAVRLARDNAYMLAAAVATGAGFLTTWANAAVGIVGEPDNPVNLGFFAVLLIALLGALAARFRPAGLARVMRLTALAQAALALWIGLAGHGQAWIFSACLCAAWLVSAELFARARRAG